MLMIKLKIKRKFGNKLDQKRTEINETDTPLPLKVTRLLSLF